MFQSGSINPSESLFSYPPGMSPEDFAFPNRLPLFVDDVVSGTSQEILDMCESNIKCIFDAMATGDLDVGIETLEMDVTNQQNRNIACK